MSRKGPRWLTAKVASYPSAVSLPLGEDHAGVVDQDVDPWAGLEELGGPVSDRGQVPQVEDDQLDLARSGLCGDVGRGRRTPLGIPGGDAPSWPGPGQGDRPSPGRCPNSPRSPPPSCPSCGHRRPPPHPRSSRPASRRPLDLARHEAAWATPLRPSDRPGGRAAATGGPLKWLMVRCASRTVAGSPGAARPAPAAEAWFSRVSRGAKVSQRDINFMGYSSGSSAGYAPTGAPA